MSTHNTSVHAALVRRGGALLALIAAVCLLAPLVVPGGYAAATEEAAVFPAWHEYLSGNVLLSVIGLLFFSAFFSSCETAFLSIQRPRLRGLREEGTLSARWVVHMLDDPSRFLTTILVGNMVVNTLIGVVLGTRVKELLENAVGLPAPAAFALAIVVTTSVLVFFGEILPKVLAVRAQEAYARLAAAPLLVVDRLLAPLRNSLLRITDFLFHVSHFHDLHAAPFITSEELKAVLTDEEAEDLIEAEGRQMIRGILEFSGICLRDILIPRPDIVALPEAATVAEAHALFREYEYSRVPLYQEDLDHIIGILSIKDLLPPLSSGESDRPVRTVARPPRYVPATMSVQDFIKYVQRYRSHLAIVVDEFGGTAGIVTLHDAIERVVGDIEEEGEEEAPLYEEIAAGVYRVRGSLAIEELSDLIQVPLEDEEHNTVAGFVMAKSEKLPSVGDAIRHLGVLFTVEQVEGKRASVVRVEAPGESQEEAS